MSRATMPPTATATALRDQLDTLRDDIRHHLGAVLEAARLLAIHRRAHDDFDFCASTSPEFAETLKRASPAWRDPYALDSDHDVLPDLLRVGCRLVDEMTARADAVLNVKGQA